MDLEVNQSILTTQIQLQDNFVIHTATASVTWQNVTKENSIQVTDSRRSTAKDLYSIT